MKTTSTLYNDVGRQDRETLIVFGSARGGTSMVAGCLAGMGVHMGNNIPQNYEDPEFVAQPIEAMKETIERKNTHHKKWGWKYPEAGKYLNELKDSVTNPRFIVVFRDLVAISNKQKNTNNVIYESALMANSLLIQQNIMLILSWQVPTLLVSYEKALSSNKDFLLELSKFSGSQLPEDTTELLEFMEPGKYKSTFADRYVA